MKCERCGEVNPAEIHTCSPQRKLQVLTAKERIAHEKSAKGNYFDLLDEHEAKLKAKNYDS